MLEAKTAERFLPPWSANFSFRPAPPKLDGRSLVSQDGSVLFADFASSSPIERDPYAK